MRAEAIPAGEGTAGSGSSAPAPSPTAWMDGLQTSRTEGSAPEQPFVTCRNVQKSYGDKEILRGIDLFVQRGEVVVLMGPSGSGKSTLLRLVNHLEPLDWGEITGDGKDVGNQSPARGGIERTRN